MYSVIVADDEPSAVDLLHMTIEKKNASFRVVATAEDGSEAFEKVKRFRPDVLFFDIRMPNMDGLELVEKIRLEGLDTLTIVVSGYSDFSYARRAIKSNVFDYLTKPVSPRDMEELLGRIEKILQRKYYQGRISVIQRIYRRERVPQEDLKKYFENKRYYLALVRRNGLLSHTFSGLGKEVFSEQNELITSYGRDENEALYLCPEELFHPGEYESLITRRIKKEIGTFGYCTIILSDEAISCEALGLTIRSMYKALDQEIVLGVNQRLRLCDCGKEEQHALTAEEEALISSFRYSVAKENFVQARISLRGLMLCFEKNRRRLLWVKRKMYALQDYLSKADTGRKEKAGKSGQRNDSQVDIDDIFAQSQSMEQAARELEEVLFGDEEQIKIHSRMDDREFIETVCSFISKHLNSINEIQDICSNFSVSQTYLGKLFKKYKNCSIHTYITAQKMEQAKLLLAGSQSVLIKDVAEQLGYRDQFYFSRVFRSYTGKSPSSYIENIKNSKEVKEEEHENYETDG